VSDVKRRVGQLERALGESPEATCPKCARWPPVVVNWDPAPRPPEPEPCPVCGRRRQVVTLDWADATLERRESEWAT